MRAIRAVYIAPILAAIVCLGCCAGGAWHFWPHDCPEQERVKVGMTADEVRSVLGNPTLQREGHWLCDCPTPKNHPVEVDFDADGRVKSVTRFDW